MILCCLRIRKSDAPTVKKVQKMKTKEKPNVSSLNKLAARVVIRSADAKMAQVLPTKTPSFFTFFR